MTLSDPRDPSTWRRKTPTGSTGTVIGDIPYRIMEGTPFGSFTEERANWNVDVLIAATDMLTLAEQLFSVSDPPTPLGMLEDDPHIERLFIKALSFKSQDTGRPIDPFSVDVDAADKTYCDRVIASLEYESIPFVEITGNATGEIYLSKAAGQRTVWVNADGSEEAINDLTLSPPFIVPQTQWTMTWPRLVYAGFQEKIELLRQAQGHVNSDVFSDLFSAPAETLLFVGYDIKIRPTWRDGGNLAEAGTTLSLEAKIIEKNIRAYQYGDQTPFDPEVAYIGHNHRWKPGAGWLRMKINGRPIYESVSFATTFDFD